ncbi:peptidylprolyl isomerase [Aestuariivirga sp.]|uniref:peptidylprolyl isomerase n=1 Tax=Aestuariivirga sp. TaxID=2650926 RepID=UPI0025C306E7|nr:peptidylprolyl isomerase [Aestuariivirga sp.]MCA3555497.1 peptidylprolyl isomerase [Aestuariivirga sp.]
MAEPENTLYLDVANARGEPRGRVTIELRPDLAPNHVARIKELAREGAYDGVVFHRVIDGFMAQGGDVQYGNTNSPGFSPGSAGTGGSRKPDLKQEFSKEPHVRGVCSMARSQNPDSANSQFFICFDDATFLDRQYTVWGKVTDGMDIVDGIKRGEPVREPDKIARMQVAADAN